MTPLRFHVIGHPEPAGSKKAFIVQRKGTPGNKRQDFMATVVDANKNAEKWKQTVAAVAKDAYKGEPMSGPIQLDVTFHIQRPQSHMGTGRNAGIVKASAKEYPTSKPDALKLTRAVEDALTGIAYHDDAQVVAEHIFKIYDDKEGVTVEVAPYVESLF